MKRTYFATVLMVICIIALILTACSKIVYGLSDGTYKMSADNENGISPTISFDLKENTFSFNFDVLSSYANIGAIKISDGNVVGKTDDGKYTYTFKIVDNDTIKFVESKSSDTKTVEGKTAVLDGAEFKYVDGSSSN